MALVPIVAVDVLLQLLLFFCYMGEADEYFYYTIVNYTLWFIPIFSVWWMTMAFKDYIEAGNEVLYVCGDRNKLIDMLMFSGIYLINLVVLYSVYSTMFPEIWLELLKMIFICVFYFGFTYFLAFLTSSVTLTFMSVVLYTFLNILIHPQSPTFPLFLSMNSLNMENLLNMYLPLALTGVLLTALGVWINKKKLKLN